MLCHACQAYWRPCPSPHERCTSNDGLQVCNDYEKLSERSTTMLLNYHCDCNDRNLNRLMQSVGNDVKLFLPSHCLTSQEAQGVAVSSPFYSMDEPTNKLRLVSLWGHYMHDTIFRSALQLRYTYFNDSVLWVTLNDLSEGVASVCLSFVCHRAEQGDVICRRPCLCCAHTLREPAALQDEAAHLDITTTAGLLSSLQAADDTSLRSSGHWYDDNGSTLTSNQTVSWLQGSVTGNAW